MTCAVCHQPINTNGWGQYAYCTPDGREYIHHECRDAAPEPTPEHLPNRSQKDTRDTHNAPSEFLTLSDAARLLGVSSQTLRRRIKNGSLPAFRLAGSQSILIERAALFLLLRPL